MAPDDGTVAKRSPFVADVAAGDMVAIHWDWVCERLDERQAATLRAWTARQLAISNQTI